MKSKIYYSRLAFIGMMVLCTISLSAQKVNENNSLSSVLENQNMRMQFKFKENYNASVEDFHEAFLANTEEEGMAFEPIFDKTGYNGTRHVRYRQYYNQVPVNGMFVTLHERDGLLNGGSGVIFSKRDFIGSESVEVSIFRDEVIKLSDENTVHTSQLERLGLAYFTVETDEGFIPTLCHKTRVHDNEHQLHYLLYLNAETGAVVHFSSEACHGHATGTATTVSYGTQSISTDEVSTSVYHLKDLTRADYIETRNNNNDPDPNTWNSTDCVDANNNWTSSEDEYTFWATDIHWGMGKFYDIMYDTFGRQSFDDADKRLMIYANTNTTWGGVAYWGSDNIFFNDWSAPSLALMGHEYTHLTTYYTCGLYYTMESGALNEGVSDILGAWFHNITHPSSFSWGGTFTGTSNPNTYYGTSYSDESNPSDNYGVHTNSAILKRWYYLTCFGGSGTNDIGNAYSVSGIGEHPTIHFVYDAMCYYFNETTEFIDARDALITVAEDYYGTCSNEVEQVANAWYAVGVGPAFSMPSSGALSGNYTLGGSTADYATFTDAVTDLHTYGTCGPVTFYVNSGTYYEQFEINQISVGALRNKITFEGAAKDSTQVRIRYNTASSKNYIVYLKGADNVHFKWLTFERYNSGTGIGGTCVRIDGIAQSNSFKNCRFMSVSLEQMAGHYSIVLSNDDNDDGNEFSKCRFENGNSAFYYRGDYGSEPKERRTYIGECEMVNQYGFAIFMGAHEDFVIEKNKIETNSSHNSFYGIYVVKSDDAGQISKNNIIGAQGGWGIWLREFKGHGTNWGYPSDYCVIQNNMVQIGSGTNRSYGIWTTDVDYAKIYHNSVNITSSNSQNCAFRTTGSNSYQNIENNIFACTGTGSGYTYYVANGAATALSSDYNNLYTTSSGIGFWQTVSVIGGLSGWQSASGEDGNSKGLNPNYHAFDDLHISSWLLKDAGTDLNVSTDIDEQSRDNTPTIGADEIRFVIKKRGPNMGNMMQTEDPGKSLDVVLYPNPVSDKLQVIFSSDYTTEMEMNVYSVSGELVYKTETFTVEKDLVATKEVHLGQGIKPGFYIMEVSGPGFTERKSFVVR